MNYAKVQGLDNQGNTCYMNAVLQILFRCKVFSKFILGQNVNIRELQCYKITLSDYFSDKVQRLEPTVIKRFIADQNALFRGFGQHDAHAFLIFILDLLDMKLKVEE